MQRNAASAETPVQTEIKLGNAAANAPKADSKEPRRLYRAKRDVRVSPSAASAIRACSSGRNRLTSPELGLSVPTKATSSSGQNVELAAKANPVRAISSAAPNSMLP